MAGGWWLVVDSAGCASAKLASLGEFFVFGEQLFHVLVQLLILCFQASNGMRGLVGPAAAGTRGLRGSHTLQLQFLALQLLRQVVHPDLAGVNFIAQGLGLLCHLVKRQSQVMDASHQIVA